MWNRLKKLWLLSSMDIHTSTSGIVILNKPRVWPKRPATVIQDNPVLND